MLVHSSLGVILSKVDVYKFFWIQHYVCNVLAQKHFLNVVVFNTLQAKLIFNFYIRIHHFGLDYMDL
jgi:hypothetical protein